MSRRPDRARCSSSRWALPGRGPSTVASKKFLQRRRWPARWLLRPRCCHPCRRKPRTARARGRPGVRLRCGRARAPHRFGRQRRAGRVAVAMSLACSPRPRVDSAMGRPPLRMHSPGGACKESHVGPRSAASSGRNFAARWRPRNNYIRADSHMGRAPIQGAKAQMNITQLANLSEDVTSAWYVKNGETVVGPVDTERLLKGVLSKRIPHDCMVTQSTWSAWRSIQQVREVAAVMKEPRFRRRATFWAPSHRSDGPARSGRGRSPRAQSARRRAVDAGYRRAGAPHPRAFRRSGDLVGARRDMDERLGEVLSARTIRRSRWQPRAAFWLARPDGRCSRTRHCATALVRGHSLGGVAMVPVFDGGKLLAMIELGRHDHPFRLSDRARLRKLHA